MTGSVESVAVYQRNAANCVEMAKEFPKPESNRIVRGGGGLLPTPLAE
jgi:hypothetical protein